MNNNTRSFFILEASAELPTSCCPQPFTGRDGIDLAVVTSAIKITPVSVFTNDSVLTSSILAARGGKSK